MRKWVGGAFALLSLLVAAPSAHAAFGIESFHAHVTTSNEADDYEQAGGHPHFGITDILFNTTEDGTPDGNVEDLRVDPPAGLVSNPQALPQCTDTQRSTTGCPPETQLGTEELQAVVDGIFLQLKVPFYNMTFDDTQVSRFGFNPEKAGDALGPLPTEVVTAVGALAPVDIIGGVRWEGDYGVYFTISDTAASPEVISSKLKFFGVPASSDHDAERGEACLEATTVVAGGGERIRRGDLPGVRPDGQSRHQLLLRAAGGVGQEGSRRGAAGLPAPTAVVRDRDRGKWRNGGPRRADATLAALEVVSGGRGHAEERQLRADHLWRRRGVADREVDAVVALPAHAADDVHSLERPKRAGYRS